MVRPNASAVGADRRVPGLDLLRAVAILAVLFMHLVDREASSRHFALPPIAGSVGYFGVELFFILSGFLIGRILIGIAGSNPGLGDWLTFLVRRWMRTLPLYFVWLVVLLIVGPPPDFWRTALYFATFTQNLAWPTVHDWFSVSWSLAVEEWFYLLFSAALLALAAFRIPRAVWWACAAFIVLPLAARIFLIPADAPFDLGMRQVALVRLDAIAFGVIMAALQLNAPALLARWRRPLFLVGCAFVFAPADAIALFGDSATFAAWRPFLLSFTSFGFALWIPAALDIAIARPRPAALVRWLSERSYCLYIVHLSIVDFVWQGVAHLHWPMLICTPLVLAISAGLAELSYRYFETPILRLRPAQPATERLRTSGAQAIPA